MERNVKLQAGKIYRNRNGSDYLCKASRDKWHGWHTMERVSDGWTLAAHGICMYEDGTIEWDYSTGGRWSSEEEAR